MRDSVVFYRSFYEAVKDLPPEEFKESVQAILDYGLDDKPPDKQGTIAHTVFSLVRPQIDANNRRFKNGCKGGKEPNRNQTRTKTEPNCNQTVTKPEPNPNQDGTKPEPKEKGERRKEKGEINNKTIMSPPTSRGELTYPYGAVVDYLNSKAGTRYKHSSEDTRKHIRARVNDGYTIDDFKAVIDRKVEEWKGTEWEKFLRPSTLFGSKFESYLNQKEEPKGKKTAFSNFLERDYDKSLMDSLVGR